VWAARPTAGGFLATFHIADHSLDVLFVRLWFDAGGSIARPLIALYICEPIPKLGQCIVFLEYRENCFRYVMEGGGFSISPAT
jgi:hypothetical protein